MTRRIRNTLAVAAVATVAMTGVAEAKSYKINAAFSGSQTGDKLKATIKDKTLGTCKMTGKLVIPDTNQTWKCKGGTIKIVGHGTTGAANDAKGTWKVNGGTGKFKGASGKGTFSGQLSTAKFTYKGTIKT